ncbi:MAG TPA: hypothetical protein VGE43_19445 [Acidimicrobiales bacterium]
MSNHARKGRTRARKPVDRYNAAELHALAVQDMVDGVHTHPTKATASMAWFAEAIARIAQLRGISKDQAFLEVAHDAEETQGRPLA